MLTRKQVQQLIIDWARGGNPKPSRYVDGYKKDPNQWMMANELYASTNPKNLSYDLEFDMTIRRVRPDWFLPWGVRKRIEREQEVLAIAKAGEPRPDIRIDSLSAAVRHQLRQLRPDWFVTESQRARTARQRRRKESIIAKYRAGISITHAERQYVYLCRIPGTSQYDPEFIALVDEIRPAVLKGSRVRSAAFRRHRKEKA
ncbi:MAG: hypothetical protein GTN64_07495 [Candidatus Latescibacteria bacterium]|nr:hypothetical protein [Candidatus Latescibacterota bacterium]NIO78447.1 hypothetical protein [Candidatus Latescibacterota bacterium]